MRLRVSRGLRLPDGEPELSRVKKKYGKGIYRARNDDGGSKELRSKVSGPNACLQNHR